MAGQKTKVPLPSPSYPFTKPNHSRDMSVLEP
jgi:hypothetical protein